MPKMSSSFKHWLPWSFPGSRTLIQEAAEVERLRQHYPERARKAELLATCTRQSMRYWMQKTEKELDKAISALWANRPE